MATEISLPRSAAGALLVRTHIRVPRWSAPAWAVIAATATFIAITCWWLTQDRSIPIFDAGLHLVLVQAVHSELASGHVFSAMAKTKPYPPLPYLVGALGIAIGGMGVAPPIIAENLVFVPLLSLGCYQLGKRAFGPLAGLLAVLFALGSPLLAAQFHVFMVDAPETALVAVSVWLITASDRFSRVGTSALAGVAVGLGMLTKEPLAFFVAGVLAVTLIRMALDFVRNRLVKLHGLVAFTVIALVIALPWYVAVYSKVRGAPYPPGVQFPNDISPPAYSLDNFTWYFWNILNFQVYLPLFAFTAIGWIWMSVRLIRRRTAGNLAPELMVGAFVAWLATTETFVHDTRYSEPLLVYLAVIGTGWLVYVGRKARLGLSAALVAVVITNTLGTTFGVGKVVVWSLPGANAVTLQHRNLVTVISTTGFLVGEPLRDGDMLATLRALRSHGVVMVDLARRFLFQSDFSAIGLTALAQIAGLKAEVGVEGPLTARDAVFAHGEIPPHGAPPCVKLSNGSGVWIRLGDAHARGARDYCPSRHPAFYGP